MSLRPAVSAPACGRNGRWRIAIHFGTTEGRCPDTNLEFLEFVMTRRYIVTGRVQGVGFRWFVEREANALGLGGWVRNTDSGAVEVLATGTADQLARLRRALQQGPRAARVDEVQEFEEEPEANETSFRIEGAW